MTKKEIKILDKLIQDLCEKQDRIKIMRQTLGINTDFDFLREVQTIEYIYECILRDRKNTGTTFFSSTSGWTVRYTRDKKKYTKGEKFWIGIHFTFVEADNYEWYNVPMNEQISPLQIQYLFENYKEHQILDEQLQYLEKYHSELIKAMREMTGHNPHYTFADETKTIEYLYAELLQERKTFKGREMSIGTSGWTVQYKRNNMKYKDGEKFYIRIHFSFTQTDNYDD